MNKGIALDPKSSLWLERNSGKIIEFHLLDIKQRFFLQIQKNKIYIFTFYDDTPDTIISGTCPAFVRQLRTNLPTDGLIIEGNLDLAQDLKVLFANFNPEIEEYLSCFLGDTLTHQSTHFVSQLKKTASSLKEHGLDDTREFLQEEQRSLPTREEVEDFYEEIASLRQDIERLEARLERRASSAQD